MTTTKVQGLATDGTVEVEGTAEYTKDGWVGIRQEGGRLDEWPAERVRAAE